MLVRETLVTLAALAACSAAADAAIVTMEFTGTISFVSGSPAPGVANGNTFTGTIQYDSASPLLPPPPNTTRPPNVGVYAPFLSYSVTVQTASGPVTLDADRLAGEFSQTGFGTNPVGFNAGMSVLDNTGDAPDIFDRFGALAQVTSTPTVLALTLEAKSDSPPPAALTSIDIPTSLNLSDFNFSKSFSIQRAGPGVHIAVGTITSLTFVPAPGIALPLGAIVPLAAKRRRARV